MLDDFSCTHDELAQRIGRSRPQISNTLRLLKLSPQVQRRVAAGVLSAGHARALLGLPDAAAMERLAQRIGVIATAGDRRDQDMLDLGAQAAQHFDDTVGAEYLLPSLTTVSQPFAELGRLALDGGPVEEIRQGDVVWFPADEKHWHGASPDTAMSHIAIQESIDGSAVTWMEKVTDADYDG